MRREGGAVLVIKMHRLYDIFWALFLITPSSAFLSHPMLLLWL